MCSSTSSVRELGAIALEVVATFACMVLFTGAGKTTSIDWPTLTSAEFPLWEPEVNAQRIDLLDMEYLVVNIVRDNQVAHVSVPVCDYARERRCDALEGDFLLQNPEVLLKGVLIRRRSILICRCVVSVQFRHHTFLPQLLPFLVRDLGYPGARRRLHSLIAGLFHLMVEIWRVDLCQQLTLFNKGSYIYIPGFEIAVNSRKDTGFLPRPNLSRQHESRWRRSNSW